jgi:DNA-binding transcriptional LysR family regulator
VDFNLLVSLDALLEEGSVGAAADRLGLSQPAMSRTLSRIRQALGDEVLVRAGRTMLPTPYAESVRSEVHELVQRGTGVLNGAGDLDLQQLDRTFTLRGHDALTDLLAPQLINDVHRAAPGVRLRFLAEPAAGADGLRTAETDLEIGSGGSDAPDTRIRHLGSSPLVLIAADGSELPAAVSPAGYAAYTHVSVSRRGRLTDPIDALLAAEGLTRHVLATVPTSRIALELVAAGGLVSTVPRLVHQAFGEHLNLESRPLPLPAEPVPITMRWHRRHDTDPAHRWLRILVEHQAMRWLRDDPDA